LGNNGRSRHRHDRRDGARRRRPLHLLPVLSMASGVTPRQLLILVLLACFVSALLGAKPLAAWVNGSIVAETVVQNAGDDWLWLSHRIGLDWPYDALRQGVRDAEGAH